MDTNPPTEISLADVERPGIKAGSFRVVTAFAFVIVVIGAFAIWGMWETHKRKAQISASVPSAMNAQAAAPAASNREATEQDAPVTKNTTAPPKGSPPPDASGPVIRYQPDATAAAPGVPFETAPPLSDAVDPNEAMELAARKAPIGVTFGSQQQQPAAPANSAGDWAAQAPAELPLDGRYPPRQQPQQQASALDRQQSFAKGDMSAIVGRTAPLPEFSLQRDTRIEATLSDNGNSQLPGQIEAIVRQNIYNSKCGQPGHGCYVEIPQGARLVGEYNAEVGYGQNRLQVAWETLIFPDTSSIDLGRMTGYSSDGAAGLTGKVDNHWKRVIGGVLMTSILDIGFSVSQSRNQTSTYPTAGNSAAAGLGQGMNQFGQEVSKRNLDIPPYIKIMLGTPVEIKTTRDIIFDGPYREMK